MIVPRVRMVAGPNGSGKTTLVEYFHKTLALPLGHYLNPDELDRELAQSGRIDLGKRGAEIESGAVLRFIEQHPLAIRAGIAGLAVEKNAVIPARTVSSGYLASIWSDYLRRRWLSEGESFTFGNCLPSRLILPGALLAKACSLLSDGAARAQA